MASKDGRIENFEPRGKKRSNPNNEMDDHVNNDDNGEWPKQKRKQQEQAVAPQMDAADLFPSSTGCLVCGVDDDHANLLLCEECNGEFHTYCLTPKLDTVPEYDWFCERCRPEAGDRLEERVCALPKAYTCRFGEICWAQGGVGYGWWPACIYDPRMTMGGARMQALKHLGKRYLVFFFQCSDTPSFEILPMNKIMTWEQGLAESCHLGKTARASGKTRHGQFRKALQEAAMEESLPKERRLDWNHQGGAGAGSTEGGGAAGINGLPSPKKVRRGRKRRRAENTTTSSSNIPIATTANSKNIGGVVGTVEPPTFARVVEKKAARRNLSFTASMQQNPPGQSTSTGNTGTSRDDSVPSTKSNSDANINASSDGHEAPAEQQPLAASAAAAAAAAATTIVSTSQDDASVDGEMYCKVQREVRVSPDDDSSTLPVLVDVGFVRLDSRQTATFAICRQVIQEELASDTTNALPCNWEWRFLVPNLGPLSKKQESKFGPMLTFLKNVVGSTCGGGGVEQKNNNVGNGSLQNPVQITLVDAPVV